MSFRDTQNPGIGGLDELTLSEETAVQTMAALGTPGQFLRTNLAGNAVEWSTVAGGGNVTKVGTPVDNQVGVWTGDGTIEGDAALTFDTTTNTLTSGIFNATGLTASEIVLTDGSKNLVSAAVVTYPSLTELTYLKGVTSALQTQLNAKGDVSKVGTPVNNQIGVWTGDGTMEGDVSLTWDGTNFNIATAKNFQIAGATILADAAGTTTLSNIDALDATTEATIEGAIDTLANLTSIQGRTVTLADAGANAVFGWDDVAGAYENLTAGEVRGAIGLATTDSPMFTAIELGHASDTTISRISAGLIAVEGNTVSLNWTSQTHTASQYEIGHASDTTLSRVSAGVAAIEGVNILTVAGGTLTGNLTLGENTSIDLDPAGSADGKYSGICITGTAGATLAFGDLIYLDGVAANNKWELTDADASATGGPVLVGMCVLAAAGDGSATKILLQGQIRADAKFPALTIGSAVYLGETVGAIQTAIPTGADNVIKVVGFALTADEIYFNPSQDHQVTVA